MPCYALFCHLIYHVNHHSTSFCLMFETAVGRSGKKLWSDKQKVNNLSRWTVVSHEAKKQHSCMSSGLHYHYSELFTQIAALNFWNGSLAAITAIAYFITDLALFIERIEPTAEGLIKSAQPFLRTSQSTSFGACFRD